MANRLKGYVRRTLIESAREYANGNRRTKESTKAACLDAVRGTNTGWWRDLIYTAPMLDMAHYYRRDIAAAVRDYVSESGQCLGDDCQRAIDAPEGYPPLTYADLIGATADRYNMGDYADDASPRGRQADAKLFGLRFAVEWLAYEVARDLGVEL